MSLSSLEMACAIVWNELENIDDVILTDPTNPEKQYAIKEALDNLSEDAKLFTKVIIDLPDDMCTSLGKPIGQEIKKFMNTHFGWTALKTHKIQTEIQNALEGTL